MDKRLFAREKVELLGLFYIQEAELGRSEFSGTVTDVCEIGFSFKVTDEKYYPLLENVVPGTVLRFYFGEEIEYFHELKRHEIIGKATVIWAEEREGCFCYGCKTMKMYSALEKYVSEKKTISFIKRGCNL